MEDPILVASCRFPVLMSGLTTESSTIVDQSALFFSFFLGEGSEALVLVRASKALANSISSSLTPSTLAPSTSSPPLVSTSLPLTTSGAASLACFLAAKALPKGLAEQRRRATSRPLHAEIFVPC